MKKRHLKDWVKKTIVGILIAIALGFIFYIDYTTTREAVEHCEKQTNGAYYCQDLR